MWWTEIDRPKRRQQGRRYLQQHSDKLNHNASYISKMLLVAMRRLLLDNQAEGCTTHLQQFEAQHQEYKRSNNECSAPVGAGKDALGPRNAGGLPPCSPEKVGGAPNEPPAAPRPLHEKRACSGTSTQRVYGMKRQEVVLGDQTLHDKRKG